MLSPAPQIASFRSRDGSAQAIRRWNVQAPLGHVVILHGIISHSGWYLKTGAHLAGAGWAVHSLDRRGSGLNVDSRGDIDRYETWIEDVREYIAHLPDNEAVVLVGISWGGLLATAVTQRYPELIAGLALICPGFYSRKGTSSMQHGAVRIATRLGLAASRFPVPLRDPRLFTDSPFWRRYIRDDPFTLRQVTLRLATASADLYAKTIREPRAISRPTLLMLAGRDPIIENARVREFVERFAADQLQSIEYERASHTLEFEPDPSQYLADLEAWCRSTCLPRSPASPERTPPPPAASPDR